jgi:hypothetical protein
MKKADRGRLWLSGSDEKATVMKKQWSHLVESSLRLRNHIFLLFHEFLLEVTFPFIFI